MQITGQLDALLGPLSVTYLLGKGGYVFGSVGLSVCLFVSLFVCLFVCGQHYSKSNKRIGMKFYGGVLGSTMKNWLNFGGDLGILRWVNEQKNTTIVVAYPDRGAGNDPKLFFFFLVAVVFHHQGSTFLQWAIWEYWSASAKEVCALWVLLVFTCSHHGYQTWEV